MSSGNCSVRFHRISSISTFLQYQDSNPDIALQLRGAKNASLQGVHRVHLISYTYDGALLEELFTRDGAGTMMTDSHYEEVRTANIQDVGGLMNLLRPLEAEGILGLSLTRTIRKRN